MTETYREFRAPSWRAGRAVTGLGPPHLSHASKVVRGLKQGLTETERYAVADHVVCQLKVRGDLWHLRDEA